MNVYTTVRLYPKDWEQLPDPASLPPRKYTHILQCPVDVALHSAYPTKQYVVVVFRHDSIHLQDVEDPFDLVLYQDPLFMSEEGEVIVIRTEETYFAPWRGARRKQLNKTASNLVKLLPNLGE